MAFFFEKQLQKEEDYDVTEVIGVDPGYKIMMQCHDNENDEYFRLTQREYLGRGMFNHQHQKIEEWKTKKASQQSKVSLMRQSEMRFRVPTWSQMKQSLQVKSQIDQGLWEYYHTSRFRNLKFKIFRMKYKTLDKFFKKFQKKGKTMTVAYGAAKFSVSAKGDIRVPQQGIIERLKKRVKVVLTSEFLTSQKCSECENQTLSVKQFGKVEELQKEKIPKLLLQKLEKAKDLERGLRVCSNRLCHSQFLH